jgi:cell division protein FtsB
MPIILNTDTTEVVTSTLLQYGILGIVSLVLGVVAWQQYKRLLDRNDSLEEKVDTLQNQMNELLIEDRNRMEKLVAENTRAIEDLRSLIMETLISSVRKN